MTVLTRDPKHALGLATPVRIVTDLAALPNDFRCDVAINLAGEPIAAGRWTVARRRRIVESRLGATRAPRCVLRSDRQPPGGAGQRLSDRFLRRGRRHDTGRDRGTGQGFAADVGAAWEAAAVRAAGPDMRVVLLRTGLELASSGGMLGGLLPVFEFGLGGPIGNGRQMTSWIHRDDPVRPIATAAADPEIGGPLNATAPNPVSNRAFAHALGRALGRPAILPLPALPPCSAARRSRRRVDAGRAESDRPSRRSSTVSASRHPRIEDALGAILGRPEVAVHVHVPAVPGSSIAALITREV